MLPILTAQQIRDADAYTIANEPVSSVDLMERASEAFVNRFTSHYPHQGQSITIYCGTGNNGGDGLAIARLLHEQGYQQIKVSIVRYSDKTSADFEANLKRLLQTPVPITEIRPGDALPADESSLIIDALLGSGLNKPLAGDFKLLVEHLNQHHTTVIAVDVPTGFFTEGVLPKDAVVLNADLVITFQQPKLNFLLPESGLYIDRWEAVNIGLDEKFIESLQSPYQWVAAADITDRLKPRRRFSNKGTYGHALIVAGQAKTMGAALLSLSACMYAGAGLTTACIPESGLTALNTYQPEVMALVRTRGELPEIEFDKFTAIAIGPGLGKDEDALALIKAILSNYKKPVVVDADALNLLAANPELLQQLPKGSVLTPHMKEFDRLFGEHNSWWERLQTLQQKAQELNINIVLKNDYTITGTPEGKLFLNSTSNAAMATGGMGDVLTGVITALLAQKHSPQDACIMGIYLHGKAGDQLALPGKRMLVLPSEVAAQLPATMASLIN